MRIKILIKENYFNKIEASVGCNLFRRLYAKTESRKEDILKNGELSCAWYVSSILYLNKLIRDLHATVESTVRDLERSGWYKIKRPRKGAVLVWERYKRYKFSSYHKHIGFYWGNKQAISNSYKLGYPVIHHFTFEGKRKIEAIYFHKKLEN